MRAIYLSLVGMLLLTGCEQMGPLPFLQSEMNEQDRAQMQAAEKFKQTGKINEAVAIYRQLVASSTYPVDAHIELAGIYRKTGHIKEAVAVMQQAQKLQPKNPKVLTALGYSLLSDKQTKAALDVFDQWVKLEPENPAAYNGKAIALDNVGDHLAAQELYHKALSYNPPNADFIQNNLAMSMILNSQWKEAIALLEPLVKKGAGKTTRQNLALAYGLSGDKKRSLEMNRKDLNAKQAQENMRFYEKYRKTLKKPVTAKAAPAKESALSPQAGANAPAGQSAGGSTVMETYKAEEPKQEGWFTYSYPGQKKN